MCDAETELQSKSLNTKRGNVGIGFVATKSNSEAVARSVLNARRLGLESFVAHYGDPDIEAIAFAHELDATVVHPSISNPKVDDLRQELIATARATSCAGIIIQTDPEIRIDYDQALEDLGEGSFSVDAFPKSSQQTQTSEEPFVMVGIPAYNEEETIGSIVREVKEYDYEVLVVDDGSIDETVTRAREAGATVIEHKKNKGYGAALSTIFDRADTLDVDHLAVVDGDGQHEPKDIPKLVETQRDKNAELVIGSRFVQDANTDMPLYRRAGLVMINFLTNMTLGRIRPAKQINDTQSGFRVYDRNAVRSLAEKHDISNQMGASTDILQYIQSEKYDIVEVGTNVYYDVDNANSINPVSHGLSLISNLIRTVENDHPLAGVGIPGFISLLIGLAFGYRTILIFINKEVFPPGHAMAAIFFSLAGILACFTAIILHSLTSKISETNSSS